MRCLAAMLRGRPDGLIVVPDPLVLAQPARIAEFAMKNRDPAMYGAREFVEAGDLISYGTNLADHVRGAARYVDKILKGARPVELPIEQPTKTASLCASRILAGDHLKTAKALGLTIPPALLLRADRVTEMKSDPCRPTQRWAVENGAHNLDGHRFWVRSRPEGRACPQALALPSRFSTNYCAPKNVNHFAY